MSGGTATHLERRRSPRRPVDRPHRSIDRHGRLRRRHTGFPLRDPAELIARGVVAGLFLGLAYRIGVDVVETGRLSGMLLLTSEFLVGVLTLVRRPARYVERSWWVRGITLVSVAGPNVLRPAGGAAIAGESTVLAVSVAGLAIVIAGKLSLGRSLGLLPANRGVVSSGLYRLVRHPIYLGYLTTHLGFLLGQPTLWNIVALGLSDVALLVRAVVEERTLSRDPRYRRYRSQVVWRLVPGVF